MPKTLGSGRKLGNEWTEVLNVKSTSKVKCKYCSTEISNKIERIKVHLKKCGKRLLYSDKSSESSTNTTVENMDLTDVEGDSPTCSMAAAMKTWLSDTSKTQRKLSKYTIKTTTAQKEILDQKISKFFYANNVPFLSVESKYFVEMIQALRPGYSPPSQRNLAGPLLDMAHNEVENNLKSQLNEVEGKVCITLCMDGWSSVKNDPIIATSMHTGKQSFLLNTIDSGPDKENVEYCLKCLKEAVGEVKEKYNSKVFAFCSDNEAKMKLLKEKMKEDDELKTIISYGCSAHYINLLEQEVTPNSVLKYIIQIQKIFRNHHQPQGWLKEKGGLMPQIPNDTRWNSQQACINTFIQNYYKYVEIANEDKLEKSITNFLSNPSLYREAQHLQKQVDVVSKALHKLQSDTATLSIAVNEWLVLLDSEVLDPYKANIRKRMEEAIEPFFFVANMMDPQYLGRNLTSQQEELAEEWISEFHPEYLAGFMAFRIKDPDLFPKIMFSEQIINMYKQQPAKWWSVMENRTLKANNLPSGFCNFFANLLTCPPSSTSFERLFSTFGLV